MHCGGLLCGCLTNRVGGGGFSIISPVLTALDLSGSTVGCNVCPSVALSKIPCPMTSNYQSFCIASVTKTPRLRITAYMYIYAVPRFLLRPNLGEYKAFEIFCQSMCVCDTVCSGNITRGHKKVLKSPRLKRPSEKGAARAVMWFDHIVPAVFH